MSRRDRIEERLRELRGPFGGSARQIAREFDGGWRAEDFTERAARNYESDAGHGALGASARDTAERIESNLRREELIKEEREHEEQLEERRWAERRREAAEEEARWEAEREEEEAEQERLAEEDERLTCEIEQERLAAEEKGE